MKLSLFVSGAAWVSTFALAWLLILRIVPATPAVYAFWAFFLLTAFVAGVTAYPRKI